MSLLRDVIAEAFGQDILEEFVFDLPAGQTRQFTTVNAHGLCAN